ncbi:MAG: 1,4-dihydroxy-6-naphthoate synthase [Terrimonas sp.]|nr:1,4-dihydroxy-6-naphthoate synthase [Terrimonas sp.]
MKLTLGFSPCPNDTFIFDALVNNKIDTEGLEFDLRMEDVQTLNEWALQGKLDVSKISYGVLPTIASRYYLLNSGGALGKGVGPLLISKEPVDEKDINDALIAIPGKNTTAHLLFSLAFPEARQKKFMIFSGIEDAVLQGEAGLGVIIHENRFTYQDKGLKKIMDLGTYWEEVTGVPIPLGGIIVKKNFDKQLVFQVDRLIQQSIAYAFEHHYPLMADFVKDHAQDMNEQVMRQHIDLYVNDYSLQMGQAGKKAVEKLFDIFNSLNGKEGPGLPEDLFPG